MPGSAIATSSLPRHAGSSAACGSPILRPERRRLNRFGERHMNVALKLRLRPAGDAARTFADDVMAGLLAEPKRLLPKYFYDQRGSRLFEEITQLPEYYPT